MLISWSTCRSGQPKSTFFLPKWVQNTQRAPQNPPECQISSKCQWFRYNIKYLAFRWGIWGFELGGELSETGRVGFSRGQPWAKAQNLTFLDASWFIWHYTTKLDKAVAEANALLAWASVYPRLWMHKCWATTPQPELILPLGSVCLKREFCHGQFNVSHDLQISLSTAFRSCITVLSSKISGHGTHTLEHAMEFPFGASDKPLWQNVQQICQWFLTSYVLNTRFTDTYQRINPPLML